MRDVVLSQQVYCSSYISNEWQTSTVFLKWKLTKDFFEGSSRCVLSNLYNILCTVNTQHTSKQYAIITIRLYLATCLGRYRPSSGHLRSTVLTYLNIVLSWPEHGRSWPKHVAKYYLIVIIASYFDVCFVLTVHNILYKLQNKFFFKLEA